MPVLNLFYTGTAAPSANLFSYGFGFNSGITSYRILARGLSQDLSMDLVRDGIVIESLTLTAGLTDSGIVPLNAIYFSTGELLELISAADATVQDAAVQLTIIFEISPGIRVESALASKQIQTPLVANYRGNLPTATEIFRHTFSQRASIFRWRGFLRTAASGTDPKLGIYKGDTLLGYLTLTGVDTEGLLSEFFDQNESLVIKVESPGSINPGVDLQLFIDFSNPEQTAFTAYQSPFVFLPPTIEASDSALKYEAPRDITLSIIQVFLSAALSSTFKLGVYIAGQLKNVCMIPAGNTESSPQQFAIPVTSGQEINIKLVEPNEPVTGLLITLDYFISSAGDSASYQFYSDPDADIILLARQLGIGGKSADALRVENLEKYKRDVDNVLNARLRSIYRTPLRKISSGNNPWPNPIQRIAQRLVLRDILHDVYTEVEPNKTAAIESNAAIADEDLKGLLGKEIILQGQPQRPRNYGSNPNTEPLREPGAGPTPTTGGSAFQRFLTPP